jgi:hypothetical protein
MASRAPNKTDARSDAAAADSPFSDPRMSLNTPFRPNRLRKYHDSALANHGESAGTQAHRANYG